MDCQYRHGRYCMLGLYGGRPSPGVCAHCGGTEVGMAAGRLAPPRVPSWPRCSRREVRMLAVRQCEGRCRRQVWCLRDDTLTTLRRCADCERRA
jgi:hypothetical protein